MHFRALLYLGLDIESARLTSSKDAEHETCPNSHPHCPQCNILISKGEGCSHMTCAYCGYDFDWDKAVQKTTPHAIVPNDEIYLWW